MVAWNTMIITVSRQAASRGEQVARRAAERLGVPLIDPEVVARAAVRLDLHREDLSGEDRAARAGERLGRTALEVAGESADDTHWTSAPMPAPDDAGFRHAIDTMIRSLADDASFVIVGYPAQVVLGRQGKGVHLLVVAPLAVRVQRMVLREDLNPRDATRVLRESDRSRLEFYKRYYDFVWDEPTGYDCVLNTGRLSVEEAAGIIEVVARGRYGAAGHSP
ncbi:MAG: cytidylate kinase-like family protein [Dehalococcoidia bacterium]